MSNQKLPPPPIPSQMHNGRSNEKQMIQPLNGRVPFVKPTTKVLPPSSSTLANLTSGTDVENILQVMTSKVDLLTSIAPTPRNELTEIQLSRPPIYADMLAPIPRKISNHCFMIYITTFSVFYFYFRGAVYMKNSHKNQIIKLFHHFLRNNDR